MAQLTLNLGQDPLRQQEILGKEFKMYTKKARTNPKIDFTKEGARKVPIVLKAPQFSARDNIYT